MVEASTGSMPRAVAGARGANFGVISAGAAATPGPFQAGGTAARQASVPRIPPPVRSQMRGPSGPFERQEATIQYPQTLPTPR